MSEQKNVTRREFLKGMAVAGAMAATAGTLAGCQQAASGPVPERWDREADVVIIGAGGTGIVAAIEARNAGASVLVLEKADRVGGTTSLSGGVIQASATEFQKAAGVEGDTPEAHYQFWMTASEGYADPDLVKVLAENAPGNIQWLVEQGLTYVSVYGVNPIPYVPPSINVARIHVPGGAGTQAKAGTGRIHVEILYNVAKSKGAVFLLGTSAKALIRDPEKGVVGVKVESGGKEQYIKAKRGVVLATSSFDHNKQMAMAFSPQQLWELETGICATAPTNTGDGIKMAMEIGADLAGMGGTIGVPATPIGSLLQAGMPEVPGIWVNKYGQRFVNESAHYAYVMRAVFHQEEHIAWAVFDENVRKLGGAALGGILGAWSDDLGPEIASGKVKAGNTPRELAQAIGVNGAALEATLTKWNEDVRKGQDTLFGKQVCLAPLETPPFYATRVTSWNLGSCGGVRINTKAQVLDVWGQPIPRLYAGGMVAGGCIGPYYPGSGTAVATTVCFGRIAGQNAAKEESWG